MGFNIENKEISIEVGKDSLLHKGGWVGKGCRVGFDGFRMIPYI
jgi:hypothetical protein